MPPETSPPVGASGGSDRPLEQLRIRRQLTLPSDLALLADQAHAEGYGFVDRLHGDWAAGRLGFAQAGAAFFACRADRMLVGICGLRAEASSRSRGRLDHLYVLPGWRRVGVGRALVGRVVAAATGRYDALVLRSDTEDAARFYEGLGFAAAVEPGTTHVLDLRSGALRSPPRPPINRPREAMSAPASPANEHESQPP